MTFLTYIEDNVDIHVCPSVQISLWGRPGDELVLGDLHVNTIKLIYSLTRHGVLGLMTADKYELLVAVCTKTTADLTKSDLDKFCSILDSLTYNRGVTVNLLGNELACTSERCDVLTMLLIKILKQNQVKIKIGLSNQSYQMIEACELKLGFSMCGVHEIIQNGLMTAEEILTLYNQFYKNSLYVNLRILDNTPEGPIVYLLNHPGVDLMNIRRQTEYLITTPPLPENPNLTELNQTLDAIDKTFRAVLAGNLVNQLRDPNRTVSDSLRYPFEESLKHEESERVDLCEVQTDFRLRYIHAYGKTEHDKGNVCSLASELGKTRSLNVGKYVVGYKTDYNLSPAFVEKYPFIIRTDVTAEPVNAEKTPYVPLLRRKKETLLFFTGTESSEEKLIIQPIYESPPGAIPPFVHECRVAQLPNPSELILDSTVPSSANTVRDSLDTFVGANCQGLEGMELGDKTSYASPMISFSDDIVGSDGP